jgi:hypothetical protein
MEDTVNKIDSFFGDLSFIICPILAEFKIQIQEIENSHHRQAETHDLPHLTLRLLPLD